MSEAELQAILMVGYGYRLERDVFGELHWLKGNPLLRPNPLNAGDDGSNFDDEETLRT